jgi:hypothetical protein
MAGIRLNFDSTAKQSGRKLLVISKRFGEKQTLAVQAVARRVKDELETEGRANIRAGGNFGSERWQEGLQARLSYQGRADIFIRMTHAVKYWRVFEYGAKILGKPLLWIPLSFSEAGRLKVRARDFPGQLFRVDRAGKAPLLLDKNGPQYFGKESVRIPKKWTLRKITAQVSRNMRKYYSEAMRNGR